jgi:hypothetical protein
VLRIRRFFPRAEDILRPDFTRPRRVLDPRSPEAAGVTPFVLWAGEPPQARWREGEGEGGNGYLAPLTPVR